MGLDELCVSHSWQSCTLSSLEFCMDYHSKIIIMKIYIFTIDYHEKKALLLIITCIITDQTLNLPDMPEEYRAIRASTGKEAFMVGVPGNAGSFLFVTSENLWHHIPLIYQMNQWMSKLWKYFNYFYDAVPVIPINHPPHKKKYNRFFTNLEFLRQFPDIKELEQVISGCRTKPVPICIPL